MPDEESRHTAETLEIVSGKLDEVAQALVKAKRRDDKLSFRLWLTITGFVLDVILTAVIAVVLSNQIGQSNRQADQSKQLAAVEAQTHADQLIGCGLGNVAKDQQRALWYQLLALSAQSSAANPKPTAAQAAAQQKLLTTFTADINAAYKHFDCAKIYDGHP